MEQRKKKRWRRRLIRGFAVALVLYVLGTLLATWLLVRRPRAPFAEPAPVLQGTAIEEHRLRTRDGEQLGAWLVRGEPHLPVVIIVHGHSDSRRSATGTINMLGGRGFGVLAISMRSHGDSTGGRVDFGYSNRADLVAAVGFVERELPDRPIVISAASMGAAATLFAGGELRERVVGFLLESPFADLETATRNRLSAFLPPGADNVIYWGMKFWSKALLPTDPEKISPVAAAREVSPAVKIVILSGDEDHFAVLAEAEAIARALPGGARIIRLPKGAHGRLYRDNQELYRQAMFELLEECAKSGDVTGAATRRAAH